MGKARVRAPSQTPEPPGPVRTCVGCRARATVGELLRVVVAGDVIVPDPAHRLPGRGAHLHLDLRCYELAARRKALTRALRLGAALPDTAVPEYLTTVLGSAVSGANSATSSEERAASSTERPQRRQTHREQAVKHQR